MGQCSCKFHSAIRSTDKSNKKYAAIVFVSLPQSLCMGEPQAGDGQHLLFCFSSAVLVHDAADDQKKAGDSGIIDGFVDDEMQEYQ